jgi:hypothetical protein
VFCKVKKSRLQMNVPVCKITSNLNITQSLEKPLYMIYLFVKMSPSVFMVAKSKRLR